MDTQQETVATSQRGIINREDINVGRGERAVSAIGGIVLVIDGIRRGGMAGIVEAVLGGALVQRGSSGRCAMYRALNIDRAQGMRASRIGQIKVQQNITINRDPQSVYDFWRNLENLPRFMNHLKSVTELDNRRSKWVAKAPVGQDVEWEVEIVEDRPAHHIAWRSLPGASVENSGAVGFVAVNDGRTTDVRISMQYSPPGGVIGALVAKLFGEEPNQQVADDLRRLKEVLESGQAESIATRRPEQGTSGVVTH